MLVAGLTSLVLVQATINLFAVMGLAPLTGVPLPFVSYGNSSLMATLFAVGLILNVARGGTAAAARTSTGSRAGKLRVVDGGRPPARERSRSSGARKAKSGGGSGGNRGARRARHGGRRTSFGIAAPRSPSSAPASGSRPSWFPAAGYEIDFVKVRGIDRRNPLRAARAGVEALGAVGAARRVLRARGRRRGDGRRRFRRRPGRPGGDRDAHAAGPDRGRQPPRAGQPSARRACAARLPRLPDRGARGRALPGDRAAGAGGGARRRPRGGAARASASPRTSAACSSSAAARAPARSTSPRSRPSPSAAGRDFHVLHLSGRRDYDELRSRLAAAPHSERYTLLDYEPDLGDSLAACDLVLGRSGGSIFEVTAAGRPAILVPYPHATADHQSANAAWMAARGRGDGDRATPSSSAERLAAEVGRAARRPRATGDDGGGLTRPRQARRGPPHRRRGAEAAVANRR